MHDIFCFTDIHGMYDLYKAIMDYCKEQDPEAVIIFCGDACDRGPRGYKIMKELLENPNVIYLKGNHEDLFVKAAYEIKKELKFEYPLVRDEVCGQLYGCHDECRYNAIQTSLANGGLSTFADWIMDGMSMEFVEKIDKLPYTFSLGKTDFCHAAGVYTTFSRVADAEYYDRKVDEYDAESLLWSRTSYNYGWETGRTVVYGHTPTPFLMEDLGEKINDDTLKNVAPYKYVGNFVPGKTGIKIDMDTGACFLGRAFVLNVLTMKAYGFEDKDFKNEEIRQHDIEKIEVIQF